MSEMIREVTLPYKEGYFEAENENGERVYQPTAEQLEKDLLRAELSTAKEQLAQSDDAALALFEAQASTDEAIVTLFETIGGITV